ncbi:MAG: hypothetical protein WAP51_02780 [Candidatus Sungiibacteriota bacterium]
MGEKLEMKRDERGYLIELFKIPGVGQVFYSTSKPGITRGNHYHLRKMERYCVIEGSAKIRLRNREAGEMREYLVSGGAPEIIDMPINWAHNITNIGETEMKLIVWVNEVFDPKDPDTYYEEV